MLRERRTDASDRYIHVGSRATSLSHSVPQQDSDDRTSMESYLGGMLGTVCNIRRAVAALPQRDPDGCTVRGVYF
ncbi:MAG: hypothetical protein KJN95_10785 [Gammaproteobacteria bacterium]|nr:hypothetical protein [Gammaproteobacteria bacterium]